MNELTKENHRSILPSQEIMITTTTTTIRNDETFVRLFASQKKKVDRDVATAEKEIDDHSPFVFLSF